MTSLSVQAEDLKVGTGPEAKPGNMVGMFYEGRLQVIMGVGLNDVHGGASYFAFSQLYVNIGFLDKQQKVRRQLRREAV